MVLFTNFNRFPVALSCTFPSLCLILFYFIYFYLDSCVIYISAASLKHPHSTPGWKVSYTQINHITHGCQRLFGKGTRN